MITMTLEKSDQNDNSDGNDDDNDDRASLTENQGKYNRLRLVVQSRFLASF